jgi:hypothetical protein
MRVLDFTSTMLHPEYRDTNVFNFLGRHERGCAGGDTDGGGEDGTGTAGRTWSSARASRHRRQRVS